MPVAPATRHTPRMRARTLTRSDLAECMELLPDWLDLGPELRRALPALWERLVDSPAMITGVTEDMAMPPGQRIQGWGVTLVLPREWVPRLQLDSAPQPHVSRRIYAALVDGSLPLMTDRDVGQGNAGQGLAMMVLHHSIRENRLGDAYMGALLNVANEAFRNHHGGYHLAEIYFEASALQGPGVAAAGFLPAAYAAGPATEALAALPPGLRPVLFRMRRDEALQQLPGTSVRHAFEHQPPLFRFSAAQRRLLWLSLFDDRDDYLMQTLGVSVHGLKKLWRGIYERIEDVAPEFFGDSSGSDDGKRGPEKRRQVLGYVRQRPEELRPWA